MNRRIVREDWYWSTIKKVAEGRFRKEEAKVDLLLELDIRARKCCEYFTKDGFSCKECFNYEKTAS